MFEGNWSQDFRHSEAVIFCRRVAPRLVETSENERL